MADMVGRGYGARRCITRSEMGRRIASPQIAFAAGVRPGRGPMREACESPDAGWRGEAVMSATLRPAWISCAQPVDKLLWIPSSRDLPCQLRDLSSRMRLPDSCDCVRGTAAVAAGMGRRHPVLRPWAKMAGPSAGSVDRGGTAAMQERVAAARCTSYEQSQADTGGLR